MPYVDGYLLPLPKKNLKLYGRMARKAGKVWRDHGALEYRDGGFSWILFRSRSHRDSVNAKVMKDPRMARMMEEGPMPFEVKQMFCGGFKVLVDA